MVSFRFSVLKAARVKQRVFVLPRIALMLMTIASSISAISLGAQNHFALRGDETTLKPMQIYFTGTTLATHNAMSETMKAVLDEDAIRQQMEHVYNKRVGQEIPHPALCLDKDVLLDGHEQARIEYENEQEPRVQASWVSEVNYFSSPSIHGVSVQKNFGASLKSVGYQYLPFGGMQLDNVHKGQFIIFRQIARPIKNVGIYTVVEDLEGDCQLLSIYNLLSPVSGRLPDASFALPPEGVFVLFDPCFRANSHRTHNMIRVDNPSLIFNLNEVDRDKLPVLEPRLQERLDSWLKDAYSQHHVMSPKNDAQVPCTVLDDDRKEGNDLFKQGKYGQAAAAYTKSIEAILKAANGWKPLVCTGAEESRRAAALLYSNRAQALIALDEYLLASWDAERALELLSQPRDDDRQDLDSSQGVTNSGQKETQTSASSPIIIKAAFRLATALANMQANTQALAVMDKHKHDEKSSQWVSLEDRLRRLTMKNQHIDVDAMYAESQKALKQGRVAKINMPNLVSNKIKVGISADKGGVRGLFAAEDIPAGTIFICEKAIATTPDDPTKPMKVVFGFEPVNDMQIKIHPPHRLALRWRTLQSIRAGGRAASVCKWVFGDTRRTDIDLQAESLCTSPIDEPWISADMLLLSSSREAKLEDEEKIGLFAVYELINHSCLANCRYRTIGDMMLCTTVVQIPKGEELTISYTDWILKKQLLQGTRLVHGWGFTCKCPMCTARDKAPDAFARAFAIMDKSHEILCTPHTQEDYTKKMTKLRNDMDMLSASLTILGEKPFQAHMSMMMHNAYLGDARASQCLEFLEEASKECNADTPMAWLFTYNPGTIEYLKAMHHMDMGHKDVVPGLMRRAKKYLETAHYGCRAIVMDKMSDVPNQRLLADVLACK